MKEKAMRYLLGALVIVVLLALLGWITFNVSRNHASVDFNPDKASADTAKAVEQVKVLGNKADDVGRKVVSEAKRTKVDIDVEREPAPVGSN